MKLQISQKCKQVVVILCLGSMVCSNSYALGQLIQSIPSAHKNAVYASDRSRQRIRQDTYFTYDIRSNILTKIVDAKKATYTYNATNQLVQIQQSNGSIVSLAKDYDTLGNMKRDSAGNQYRYNLFGQLIRFDNLRTGVKAYYQYYANGLRSTKTISTNPFIGPVDYYYDDAENANIVNERQGLLTSSYLLPSGHMVRYVNNGIGNITKQIAMHGGKDVAAILNDRGKLQRTYHYSPNGIIRPIGLQDLIAKHMNRKVSSFRMAANPFQYSGEYRDQESGLNYLRTRYYNPGIQRFIQRDSYQLLNRYAYVQGNPIMAVDPSGHKLKAWKIAAIAVGSVVGLVALSYLVKRSISWCLRGSVQTEERSAKSGKFLKEANHYFVESGNIKKVQDNYLTRNDQKYVKTQLSLKKNLSSIALNARMGRTVNTTVLFEDDRIMAFPPKTSGLNRRRYLIIPKEPIRYIEVLSSGERKQLESYISDQFPEIVQGIMQKGGLQDQEGLGFHVYLDNPNERREGQLHYHLIPTFDGYKRQGMYYRYYDKDSEGNWRHRR